MSAIASLPALGAVFSARYRMLLQYRAAALAGFGTQLFWGFLRLMILFAFVRAAPGASPMSLADLTAYVWLGQALLGLLPWNVDPELARLIREGRVAHERLRPVATYWLWFARTLAFRTATTSLRSLPMVVMAALLLPGLGLEAWSLRPPASAGAAAAFAVALPGAALLATAITMLVQASLLLTIDYRGVNRIMAAAVMLGSGMIVPLPLLPELWQELLRWLPFRGICDAPYRLWSGHLPPAALAEIAALQAGWLVLLVAAGRGLLRRGFARHEIQGG